MTSENDHNVFIKSDSSLSWIKDCIRYAEDHKWSESYIQNLRNRVDSDSQINLFPYITEAEDKKQMYTITDHQAQCSKTLQPLLKTTRTYTTRMPQWATRLWITYLRMQDGKEDDPLKPPVRWNPLAEHPEPYLQFLCRDVHLASWIHMIWTCRIRGFLFGTFIEEMGSDFLRSWYLSHLGTMVRFRSATEVQSLWSMDDTDTSWEGHWYEKDPHPEKRRTDESTAPRQQKLKKPDSISRFFHRS